MTFNKERWGEHKTMKFIRLYEQHPCLWDIRLPDYKNRRARIAAYEKILAKMGAEPNFGRTECQNKIRNIRSQYCQELKKIRVSRKIGGAVYKPTLLWFDVLHNCLKDIVVQQERVHPYPMEEQETRQEKEGTSDIEFVDYSIVKEESDDTECESMTEVTINIPPNQTLDVSTSNVYEEYEADFKNKDSEGLQRLTSAIQKIENIVMTNSSMTEFDVFGQSVAAQLKNMPFDDALRLQLEIQHLITMKRIKKNETE